MSMNIKFDNLTGKYRVQTIYVSVLFDSQFYYWGHDYYMKISTEVTHKSICQACQCTYSIELRVVD